MIPNSTPAQATYRRPCLHSSGVQHLPGMLEALLPTPGPLQQMPTPQATAPPSKATANPHCKTGIAGTCATLQEGPTGDRSGLAVQQAQSSSCGLG